MTFAERKGSFDPTQQVRLSARKAKFLLPQLASLNEAILHRQMLSSVYTAEFGRHFDIMPTAMVLRFPLLVQNKADFIERSRALGLQVGDWFATPVHPADIREVGVAYTHGSCPTAEWLCKHLVNLPVSMSYNVVDAQYIKNVCTSILSVQSEHSG